MADPRHVDIVRATERLPGAPFTAALNIAPVPEQGLNGRKREPTFYHRYGDLFGWSCVLWSALLVGWSFLRERNRENSHA